MPEIYEQELDKEDIVLMCSDGLTNMIREKRILGLIKSEKNPERILIEAANLAGGTDNITVIIIKDIVEG